MSGYPFDTILVNARVVNLNDVLQQQALSRDAFEDSLFSFLREWHSGTEKFPQHTSGSTGTPKTISVTRNQMITSARLTAEALGLKPGDTALICLSPDFIAGKMMVVRCLVSGMKMIAATPSANPLEHLGPETIDFTAMVPYQVHDILHSSHSAKLEQIGSLIIGGAALDDESLALLQPLRCRCYATYGMTETVSHVALKKLNGPDATDDYKTLPGIVISHDERECLVIEAPHFEGRIVTNDVVQIKDGRTFAWLGRWDNIINTGGMKVMPEDLEAEAGKVLREEKINNRFFVGSLPDSKLGSRIVLIVEGTLAGDVRETLMTRLRGQLPGYKTPKEIFVVPRFEYTGSDKINRKETLRGIAGS
jgi:O-succinylbenzoic acid--CoA ligase